MKAPAETRILVVEDDPFFQHVLHKRLARDGYQVLTAGDGREGMKAILIEREPEYQADIARRMELAEKPTKRAAVAASKNKLQGAEGTPLFGDA